MRGALDTTDTVGGEEPIPPIEKDAPPVVLHDAASPGFNQSAQRGASRSRLLLSAAVVCRSVAVADIAFLVRRSCREICML